MKLPLLLTHYLREHKLLRLPGLGTLHYTGAQTNADGEPILNQSDIRFEQTSIKEADEAFIDYIKQQTGKIKPLAIADLNSYIESGLQMLNIGRAFHIEGIGSLQKTKDGLEFTAREVVMIRKDESTGSKADQDKKRSVFDDEKYNPPVNPWQKIVVAALIVGGLAIVVLGGYYLYNQNKGEAVIQEVKPAPPTDSLNILHDSIPKADTTNTNVASYASLNPGSYKFILETTSSKKRALKRYTQLKYSNLKMETVDSTAFKLYFVIPADAKDTTRIKDSLNRYYASKVKIEL